MPNPYIPRVAVHEQAEAILQDRAGQKTLLKLMVKNQRVLGQYVKGMVQQIGVRQTPTLRTLAAIIRIFELAGGSLRFVELGHIRAAERTVGAVVQTLLPADATLPERVRQHDWRAQPHLIDEVVMDLFTEDALDMAPSDRLQLFCVMWVVIEALDAAWTPPEGFQGSGPYAYTPVDGDVPAEGI